tara:strand:- start:59 stop:244 length:186 start_codon:yes stop_codon:yes gene_type:complete
LLLARSLEDARDEKIITLRSDVRYLDDDVHIVVVGVIAAIFAVEKWMRHGYLNGAAESANR